MSRFTRFADPYKRCNVCGGWVTGYRPQAVGRDVLAPCRHTGDYTDVCPSWSPVDGCTCEQVFGSRPHGVPPWTWRPGVRR